MTHERFVHDGVSIAWRHDGSGSNPPLVLLHGLSGSSTTYDAVVRALAPIEVFRLDFRGHGHSDRAPGTYQVPYYAGDVAAFIEAIVGRPVILGGHSLGGVVTLHLAASRPDLVVAAFAEDPPLYFCDQALFDQSMFATIFPVLEDTMRRLQAEHASRDEVRAMVAEAPSPAGGQARDHMSPEAIEARVDAMLLCDPDVWGPAIHGGALSGYDPEAPVAGPVTVLQADPDMGPAFWPDHADRYRKAVPHAEIVLVKGAPHGIHTHLTAFDRYLEHLRSLIRSAS